MGRSIHKLSARQVATLSEPGYYGDGGNLYLQVSKTGTRSWIIRYTFAGRKHDMGIGPLRDVPLAKAREKAALARAQILDGIDPIAHKNEARPKAGRPTFKMCAEDYIEANKAGWKNGKHVDQWRNTLATYAYEKIGDRPIDRISTDDVMEVLKPIWSSKNETASRVRGRIESVLAYAKVLYGEPVENPAVWRGHLDQLLPRPTKVKAVKHHEAMPYTDLPAFFALLRKQPGIAARCLEFTILTGARTSEATGAPHKEFNLGMGRWIIPKERMKPGKEHRVPLSDAALAIVNGMPKGAPDSLVFAMPSGKEMSNMSMLAVLKRMEVGQFTVHGFRSSFRDWAAEEGYPSDLAEMALSHTIKDKVEAAYRRGDMFRRREELMAEWAVFCLGGTKVTDDDWTI